MYSVFIKVPVSERLPEKDGILICIGQEGEPFITLHHVGFSLSSSAAYWLEEVELPSGDDMEALAIQYEDNMSFSTTSDGFEAGAKYILNAIKK